MSWSQSWLPKKQYQEINTKRSCAHGTLNTIPSKLFWAVFPNLFWLQSAGHITSFSSIPYGSNSEYWPQKWSQIGNIHSIILYVMAMLVGRALLTLNHQSLYSWTRLGRNKLPDRSTDLIHYLMENRLRHVIYKSQYYSIYWTTLGSYFFFF